MSDFKNKKISFNKSVFIGLFLLLSFSVFQTKAQKFIYGSNSYWIYKNLQNNKIDTLTVVFSEHYRYQLPKGGFVDLDYSKINTSDSSYYLYNMADYNIYTSFYRYDWFDCYGENFIYLEDSSTLCQTNVKFITKYDSITIGNKVYNNVKKVLVQNNKIENSNNSYYYWVDTIGYIKKVVISESDTLEWVLTHYKLYPYTLNTDIIEFKQNNILIFPNPFYDKIFINTEQTDLNTKIYDLNGKLLFTSDICNKNIDLFFLDQGVYIMVINSERNSLNAIFRIIKL